MMENMPFLIGGGEINKQALHGIARQMGALTKRAFWVVDIYRCSLSFVSPSL